ncbi:MAG: DUF4168 domain-containing protein [Desulfohalobiaceae bacterium]
MNYLKTLVLFVMASAFLLVGAPASEAQTDQGQGSFAQEQAGEVDVSEKQLEKVAAAYVEITQISRQAQDKLAGAEDQEQAQQIQTEANDEMIAAVEGEGLDVDTYNTVLQSVQSDPDLRDEFMSKVEKH